MLKGIDKQKAKVYRCSFSDISPIFKEFHYKEDHIGGGILECYLMTYKGEIVGGAVSGKPRHESKYPSCIDIRRMACIDETPKNAESYFLSQIIKHLASNYPIKNVLSYSDTTVNHLGVIYKAANFKNTGETAPSKWIEWKGQRYHMRSLTIDRDYSRRINEALETGEAEIKTGKPKIVWIYEISKKLKRKNKLLPIYTTQGQLEIFNA